MNIRDIAYAVTQRAWRLLPQSLRHGVWRHVGQAIRTQMLRAQLARPASTPQDGPLVVAGLFRTANGIGEAARSTWRSLDAAGLSPMAVDLSGALGAPVDVDSTIPTVEMPKTARGNVILQVNAPETFAALDALQMTRGRDWYRIGYWAWELPTFPTGWNKAFPLVSAVWTVSEFSKAALSRHPKAPPIKVLPHAVTPPPSIQKQRGAFGIDDAAFTVLAMADAMSSLTRKNTAAAIDAFTRAFAGDASAHLIIKTRNLAASPASLERLNRAIGGASNISIMDQSIPDADRWALIRAVDVVLSLHRSEGFGLVLAEAMAMGTPVIATGWSGNLDFMSNDNSHLVPATMVHVDDPDGVYKRHKAVWANPNIEAAATALREVRTGRTTEHRRKAATLTLNTQLSAAAVGKKMAHELHKSI